MNQDKRKIIIPLILAALIVALILLLSFCGKSCGKNNAPEGSVNDQAASNEPGSHSLESLLAEKAPSTEGAAAETEGKETEKINAESAAAAASSRRSKRVPGTLPAATEEKTADPVDMTDNGLETSASLEPDATSPETTAAEDLKPVDTSAAVRIETLAQPTAQPTTRAAQAATKATQPSTAASQPASTAAAQPTAKAAQPTTKPAQPTTKAAQPTTRAVQPTTKPAQPTTTAAAHVCNWQAVVTTVYHAETRRSIYHPAETRTVHHPEQGHYEDVLKYKPAWDEPVYEDHAFCNACHLDLSISSVDAVDHILAVHNGLSGWHGEKVQVGTIHHKAEPYYEKTWIVDKPAWEEVIVDKPESWEWVVDTPARTEEIITGYRCPGCGATKPAP